MVFKEFGIRLNFKPTIAGDVIRLKVRPEVSSLDFNNGLTLSGFRIPSLITRRAETDVELRDGQTFAIAGLMSNISQNDAAAIPLLEQAADHRPAVQEQLQARRADRADGADHAAPGPAARARRGAAAADRSEACSSTRPAMPDAAAAMSEQLEGGAGLVDAPQSSNGVPVKR